MNSLVYVFFFYLTAPLKQVPPTVDFDDSLMNNDLDYNSSIEHGISFVLNK